MIKFILGIIFAVVLLLLVAIGVALLGFLPMRANTAPPKLESRRFRNIEGKHISSRAGKQRPGAGSKLSAVEVAGLRLYALVANLSAPVRRLHGGRSAEVLRRSDLTQ